MIMFAERKTVEIYTALLALEPDPATLALTVRLQDGYDKDATTFVPQGEPRQFTIPAGTGSGVMNAPLSAVLSGIGVSADQVTLKSLIMGLIEQALRDSGQI